jgi:hypothetical protein
MSKTVKGERVVRLELGAWTAGYRFIIDGLGTSRVFTAQRLADAEQECKDTACFVVGTKNVRFDKFLGDF